MSPLPSQQVKEGLQLLHHLNGKKILAGEAVAKGLANETKKTHLSGNETLVGASLNTAEETKASILKLLKERGTNSLLDLPLAGLNHVPGLKSFGGKVSDVVAKGQEAVYNADRAAGNFLAKGKIGKAIFTHTDAVPSAKVTTDTGEVLDAYVPTRVARLSAPIDKVKPVAVPLLAVGGASAMFGHTDGDQDPTKKEVTASNLEHEYEEKIAAIVEESKEAFDIMLSKYAALSDKTKTASFILKEASTKMIELEGSIEKLATENEILKLQLLAKERSHRATKLAKEMLNKGMIKQADYNDQVDHIMGLNDDGYNLLSKTVDNVPTKLAAYGQNGLSKISYVLADDISSQEGKSLAEAILKFGR